MPHRPDATPIHEPLRYRSMLSYILLTLGGLLFGSVVYRYDMHEREPWWMLLLSCAGGAVAMASAFALEYAALVALANSGLPYDYALVHATLAGVLEELGKFLIPLAALLLFRKQFNDPMDGLIYGCMAGLGAALYEAVWFMVNEPATTQDAAAWLPLLHHRAQDAVRLLMHTCWGGLGGYALGLIVLKKPYRLELAKTLGGAILLHLVWDLFVGFANEQTLAHRLFAALTLGATVVWFGFLTVQANRWSRQMHAPQSKQKLTTRIIRAILTRKFK
ncbi:MAG: PrsW family glutamic-type intramembrane protease [Phycisphaerales bacterium JB063]